MSERTPGGQTPKSKRIALIDADTLVFTAASVSERRVLGDADVDVWVDTQTLGEAYDQVVRAAEAIMAAVTADEAYLCLTDRRNFRKDILPTYKANRKTMHTPKFRAPLVGLLRDRRPFPVLVTPGLEADDVLGITSGVLRKAGHTPIICSEDKDLRSVPGWLYHRGQLLPISQREADYRHAWQTLVGDSVDNFKGCRNVGPKKADAILEPYSLAGYVGGGYLRSRLDPVDYARLWDRVIAEFTLRGHTVQYALTQARVARILRDTDWNPEKHEPILWTPPTTLPEPTKAPATKPAETIPAA